MIDCVCSGILRIEITWQEKRELSVKPGPAQTSARDREDHLMLRTALSTWSIHNALGPMYRESENGGLIADSSIAGELDLLSVPARMAAAEIQTLEICHFHFPSTDDAYLEDLRSTMGQSKIELYSILVDAGNIVDPDAEARERDMTWIRSWIDVAGRCGATHARIIAGEAKVDHGGEPEDHPAVKLSARNLVALADYGQSRGVQVITENFRSLASRPEPLLAVLSLCEGRVGLCADFGNYPLPGRKENLSAILPHATSVHAKPEFGDNGQMDRTEFEGNLDLAREHGFDGPFSLIYEGDGDEWHGVARIRDVVQKHI